MGIEPEIKIEDRRGDCLFPNPAYVDRLMDDLGAAYAAYRAVFSTPHRIDALNVCEKIGPVADAIAAVHFSFSSWLDGNRIMHKSVADGLSASEMEEIST